MFDFRLKVFDVVAKRLNFTKAAEELFITQPAVSKHIHEIEAHYKTKLFERNGSKIKLTKAGKVLHVYTGRLVRIYQNIEFELSALSQDVRGTLRIGTSTTVANYFLPKHLATFKKKFPNLKISVTAHNTELIENLLTESKIDIGIVEGQSKRKYIKYTPIAKDEIVLCTNTANPLVKKDLITVIDLQKLPLVIREQGSGSLEVIISALKSIGVNLSNLSIELQLENTESIKSYLLHSQAFAFLSMHSVFKELKDGYFKIIDIKGLNIERFFYFISQPGDVHDLHEIFYRHLILQ